MVLIVAIVLRKWLTRLEITLTLESVAKMVILWQKIDKAKVVNFCNNLFTVIRSQQETAFPETPNSIRTHTKHEKGNARATHVLLGSKSQFQCFWQTVINAFNDYWGSIALYWVTSSIPHASRLNLSMHRSNMENANTWRRGYIHGGSTEYTLDAQIHLLLWNTSFWDICMNDVTMLIIM